MSKLYKEHKIKPLSSVLSIFIQIPILFGLYKILITEVNTIVDKITFFNINITEKNIYLAIIAFVSMMFLMRLSVKDITVDEKASDFQKEFTKIMRIQMQYFLPVIIFISSIILPAGLVLYFIISNLFGIFQLYLIKKIVK